MRKAARSVLFAALVIGLAGGRGAMADEAAQTPRIVASIAPLHSLAALVAEGVSTPELLVSGNASPHTYSLRPSEARALAEADLVIWVGPALETFLSETLDNLAGDARRLTVADLPGLRRLPARSGGIWGEHAHAHGDHAGDDDDHAEHVRDDEDHADHAHGDHDDHDEHGRDDHDDHAHDSDDDTAPMRALDAHLWLNPANAMVTLEAIAAALAELDPDNAAAYRDNARRARARLEVLDANLAARLAPVSERPFVVFHDAYQYFEERYGLSAVGAVTVSPDIQPGARRLGELRDEVARRGAVCIFAEPQFPPRVIEMIAGETGAGIGVLDPLGADIEPGPGHYPTLMQELAAAAADCLAGPA